MLQRPDGTPNIAVFCDYENVAIGARDAKFDPFDVGLVLERLLDKGQVVVKKAYSDWERFKSDRRALHEAAFEMIEVPHVSYSGKNSADIRLVVDAMDLCYTKPHIDLFALVTGDSDFSPLVSKLRENDKTVVGLGVKSSTSDLLVANGDECIYFDDLVRTKRKGTKRPSAIKKTTPTTKRDQALDQVVDVVRSLLREREGVLWGSLVKQTLKRRRPNFDESYHGYRNFSDLLEDAQRENLLVIQRDDPSGGYIVLDLGTNTAET